MRHLEIRDLWLQKEVAEGRLEVHKVAGEENPADLMTKILGLRDIQARLGYVLIFLDPHGSPRWAIEKLIWGMC